MDCCPGSKQVEKQAIEEGISKIFEEAGFQLRQTRVFGLSGHE
jgi:homoaconitase/3-isopropylmalate dehydratase large subunit